MKMVVIAAPKALAGFLKKIFHMEHAVRRDADARGVIAAVFQTAKAVQQNGRRLFAADISNDSTHNKKAS